MKNPTSRINPIIVAPTVLKANKGDERLHTDGRIVTEVNFVTGLIIID